jgi:hypothetical protein
MKLREPQEIISNNDSRFRVAACGRRFGKTYLSINEMAKFARFPNKRILAVAPTYKQVKNVIWDDLKTLLVSCNWVKKINESELQIRLVNNSTITLRSSDNYDALRGGKYDFIVLDECGDINPATWYSVLRPTLSDTGGSALFIGSPKGRNWFYDLWLQGGATADWAAFQFTTVEGGNVPPEEVEAARRDLDTRTFEQEYLAQFVNYAGVIFYAFSEDNVAKCEGWEDKTLPLHIGIDFNVSPISAVVGVYRDNILHIFDEIEIYSSNTNELVQEIKQRYPNRHIFAYPDATGKRMNTNSGGISDHIILQNAGFKLQNDLSNPPVADAISSVNSMLCNSKGERKLLIDPKCRRLREVMIKWTYKEGTRQPDKESGLDHLADCIRYVCYKLSPPTIHMFNRGKSYRTVGRML